MKPELTITIASLPDRENLVAELWFGDVQWGELNDLPAKAGRLLEA